MCGIDATATVTVDEGQVAVFAGAHLLYGAYDRPSSKRTTTGRLREEGRVDDWRGGGRQRGELFPAAFANSGASLLAVASFPVAAHR